MLYTVSEFIRRLPSVVNDATGKGLFALFVTYNEVSGYGEGEVLTGKPGLTLKIQAGFQDVSVPYGLMGYAALAVGDTETADRMERLIDESGRVAQAELEVKSAGIHDELAERSTEAKVLLVVYAGLTAFGEAIEFARGLRKQAPQAFVAVLTCDCELGRKERVFASLIAAGEVSAAIVTHRCGGRLAMREILDATIAAWPVHAAAN